MSSGGRWEYANGWYDYRGHVRNGSSGLGQAAFVVGVVTRYEAPLTPTLADELFDFWRRIFGDEDPDVPKRVFLGSETAHNRNIVHLTTRAGRVVGTCGTTRSRTVRALGGFGEVATDPDQRGRGIASELCVQAVEEFRKEGGEVLFLGTGNPAAARIYHRLGWRKLAGAQVMANVTGGASPEEFLVGWFAEPAPVAIEPASAAARVPIIPLMVSPHDWQVLDANAGMLSTRYAVQGSCMGLYRRYGYVIQDGRGAWFVAVAEDGRVVGQSTARLTAPGRCNVDGFVHHRFADSWEGLIRAAIGWGADNGASAATALLSVEDEEKRERFEGLGFREEGPGDGFAVGDREVPGIVMISG